MIKNYLKTAFRSLLKNKGFTAINLLGLALGLASCLLIMFYVFDELSFDNYNTNIDRIYRLNNDIKFGGNSNTYAVSAPPVAASLKSEFPEVEQVVRFRMRGGNQVKKGIQNIQEDRMVYADNSLFYVFTLPMLFGSAANALTEPHTAVITEDMAEKYFGSKNAVGKLLTFNNGDQFKITGVIKNIPKQSHFHFDFFLSMPTLDESKENAWLSNNFNTYLLLRQGADYKKLEAKFPEFMKSHIGPQIQSELHLTYDKFEQNGDYFRLSLFPLKKIHLYSNTPNEMGVNGNIQYVYIFSAITLFILIIASVNFMNLSTARSFNRAREVGVRKVLGSSRWNLIGQFLAESILITMAGAIIALLIGWALLPLFNQVSDKDLTITPQIIGWLLPIFFIFILLIGCLAGSYPALFLSRFNPTDVLKGRLSSGFKGGFLRSFLVVFQFTISIFLIIGTLVISNQLKYIRNKDLGYNRDHVLIIRNVSTLGPAANTFKNEVKQILGVQNAALSNTLPISSADNHTTYFKSPVFDQKQAVLSSEWNVDEDYISTLDMKMVSGRNFSKDMLTDSTGVIVNQTFAKLIDNSKAIGQFLYTPANNTGTKINKYHIIGIVKDFNFKSLRDNVTPLILNLSSDRNNLSVRIKSADISGLLRQLNDKWKYLSANQQFNYSFMDEDFDLLYRSDQRSGTIFFTFTTLAIIIACLGLFGLAAYAAEQRTKEIGIRKVLGAKVSTIVGMLSKDFLKLIAIAILIASPLAWWIMEKWLQGFAYRQDIQWWIIVVADAGAIFIAFLTVSYQSIKAAFINPVNSIRSE